MKNRIKFVQRQLNQRGLSVGLEDGILGPRTLTVLSSIDGIPGNWSKQRKVTRFIQNLAIENNIECGPPDGYWGPQTSYAFDVLKDRLELQLEEEIFRPEDIADVNPNSWPGQSDLQALEDYFGKQGERQSRAQLPYPHRLSWKLETSIDSFQCHELVGPSIERVLGRVLDHYGPQRIRELRLDVWGGCSVVRKMRGGSKPSMHSWGIAIDYDPTRNKLRWSRERATLARPEYDAWWSFWEEEGWVSLGRTRNFDWMHVQAVKL